MRRTPGVQETGPGPDSPVPRERVVGRAGWTQDKAVRRAWVQNSPHSSGQPGLGGEGQTLGLGWASASAQARCPAVGGMGQASVGLGFLSQ